MLNSSGWEFHHDRSENIFLNAVCLPPKLVQNSWFVPQNFYTTSSALINRGFTYLRMNLISYNGKLSFSRCLRHVKEEQCNSVIMFLLPFQGVQQTQRLSLFNYLNLLESLKLRLVNFANDARIVWCQLNRLVRELK